MAPPPKLQPLAAPSVGCVVCLVLVSQLIIVGFVEINCRINDNKGVVPWHVWYTSAFFALIGTSALLGVHPVASASGALSKMIAASRRPKA